MQSRQKIKRRLLDALDGLHQFALPPTLAEEEFKNVWNAVESDLKAQGRTFEDEGTTEEKAREEYRAIADRRVRLGLVLAEIGDKNNISVTDDEITRSIVERTRQFPGREQEIWEHYRKNPAAVAGVRAPIFEEKVVDFLIELATVTDKAGLPRGALQGRRRQRPGRLSVIASSTRIVEIGRWDAYPTSLATAGACGAGCAARSAVAAPIPSGVL